MKTLLLACLLCVAFAGIRPACAAQGEPAGAPISQADIQVLEQQDGATLAYVLARTYLSDEQWKEKVDEIRRKFAVWEQDHDGDMGDYLNDKFVLVAMGAADGDPEKVKKSLTWLAFYKEFNQQAPSMVKTFLSEHKGSMTRLLTDFTWEKASDYVKKKRWREDIAERKRQLKLEEERRKAEKKNDKSDDNG